MTKEKNVSGDVVDHVEKVRRMVRMVILVVETKIRRGISDCAW